ncbi:hypothetical protein E8D34_09740 [Nocardioides sp. GY 10113]|uniref:hypothetical protein n=1 Tax=Nocardioides sp. GY 10113 TaxID=2569761 RepID=UPI0010A82060|nr:hypothetical protein [Nocardioides sp. GY 10113]TIC87404.1 hypothetical protein E8D34_09740 [Nocardioides sp. GY 10113]
MRSARRSSALVALAVPAALVALAGCGGDDTAATDPVAEPTTESTESTGAGDDATLPDCSAVWQEGADLPSEYGGCAAEGAAVEPTIIECSSGQRVVTYDDHYWALRGNVIGFAADGLKDDPAYKKMIYACLA